MQMAGNNSSSFEEQGWKSFEDHKLQRLGQVLEAERSSHGFSVHFQHSSLKRDVQVTDFVLMFFLLKITKVDFLFLQNWQAQIANWKMVGKWDSEERQGIKQV